MSEIWDLAAAEASPLRSQKLSVALEAVRQMTAASPREPWLYAYAAGILVALGRKPEALEHLRAAQDAYPEMPLYRDRDFALHQRQARDRGLPALLLNTQFKSGSIFIKTRLQDGLGLPSCYISRTPLEDRIVPGWLALFARGGAISQEHLPPEPEVLDALAQSGIGRLVVHLRDPRQSMLSAIHHYTGLYQKESPSSLTVRAEFPAGYADWSLERRIDHYLDRLFSDQVRWADGWVGQAAAPHPGLEVLVVSFNQFRADPRGYFARLLEFWRIDPARFDSRVLEEVPRPGELHFRKGSLDEWRSVLTLDQQVRATAAMTPALLEYLDRQPGVSG